MAVVCLSSLYLGYISILIIFLSRYFSTVARIFAVHDLAILILLSYAKLLRTVFQASTISYPVEKVWAYNWYQYHALYLYSKHVPLFLAYVHIFLLLLWLPYTISVLLLTQCLHKLPSYRMARLCVRLKPFPDNHRYWIGLLLLI